MSQDLLEQKRLLQLKKKELQLLQQRKNAEKCLPHLFKKHYAWSRLYCNSTNRINLICAANQVGKSSAAIRRVIMNATDPARWQKMWGLKTAPAQFWYFYPDMATVAREFSTKWEEWLPSGDFANDPQYGWKMVKGRAGGEINGIEFNAGPRLYFMTYTKDARSLQASTIHEVTADEELPLHLYDELILRLTRTKGIFNSVFTPTLNQAFWREVFETDRRLPMALKQQVSMYECLHYDDGSPSEFFTKEAIEDIASKCKSDLEVDRRIYGKFVTEEGRLFSGFTTKNVVPRKPITGLQIYAGVDPGGGGKGHPAAITFVALEPDCRKGYVFSCWRGDGVETSSQDILNKFVELKGKRNVTLAVYDFQAKDFGIIAERAGHGFIKANKARDLGEDLMNTLFKSGMLQVFDDGHDGELNKLVIELMHAMQTPMGKRAVGSFKHGDDLRDALRYTLMAMPWDMTDLVMTEDEITPPPPARALTKAEMDAEFVAAQIRERRGMRDGEKVQDGWDAEFNEEIDEQNERYG